jgi:hypothetical protein
MRPSKLFVIVLLAGTLGVFGCSDDPPSNGNGGSGGTAGTGGTGGSVDLGCDEGRCVEAAQAMACEDGIGTCIAAEPANEERCIIAGNLVFCSEGGTGGTGGTGGIGGTGGTGGTGEPPDPDLVCNRGLCEVQGDPKEKCEFALTVCIANNPEVNWEDCVGAVLLIFCNVED